MRIFAEIARLAPMAILLSIAMLSQALAMAHVGVDRNAPDPQHGIYTICADGEIKTVRMGQNGEPLEHDHSDLHCPLCVLSNAFVLVGNSSERVPIRFTSALDYDRIIQVVEIRRLDPAFLNCLDPPASI